MWQTECPEWDTSATRAQRRTTPTVGTSGHCRRALAADEMATTLKRSEIAHASRITRPYRAAPLSALFLFQSNPSRRISPHPSLHPANIPTVHLLFSPSHLPFLPSFHPSSIVSSLSYRSPSFTFLLYLISLLIANCTLYSSQATAAACSVAPSPSSYLLLSVSDLNLWHDGGK